MPAGHWNDVANQKLFFDQMASKLGIRKPEDWYVVSRGTVLQMGGSFVNSHYGGSLVRGITFFSLFVDLLSIEIYLP
jgi:hypothetical protein